LSYFFEFEEVYLFRIIWNFVGPCSLQEMITSGSHQDYSDSGVRTTYINQTNEGNSRSHNILEEVYKRLCVDHNTYEKVVEEGSKVPVERGLSKGFGHLKTKTSDHTNFNIFKLEQGVLI
jgi:hypothetical protein